MLRCLAIAVLAGLTVLAVADVFMPPGYKEVIQVTSDADYDLGGELNNRGQMVFSKRLDPYDQFTSEIFLYDNGQLIRLTDDYIWDAFPDINDAGDIVWSRANGADDTFEIVLYRDGKLAQLTVDEQKDYDPCINNLGHVAWHKRTEQGCEWADSFICFWDGVQTQAITAPGNADKSAFLNDHDDLAWTRYNFCTKPWTSQIILLLSDGTLTALTGDTGGPRAPVTNNSRKVAWAGQDPPDWDDYIATWQDGVTSVLTLWGSGLSMNNRGQIFFNRWHDDSSTYQVWLYTGGKFWQITDDPFWNRLGGNRGVNDYGDIAWIAGPPGDTDVLLMKRFPLGDLNCDGMVDAFDIDPFVLALTDPPQYASSYPNCDWLLGDTNLDGTVNAFDIDPFVDILVP
jgi:hypothetical protein